MLFKIRMASNNGGAGDGTEHENNKHEMENDENDKNEMENDT